MSEKEDQPKPRQHKTNTPGKPRVFAIRKDGEGFRLSRRGFLGVAAGAAAASSAELGCSTPSRRKTDCKDFKAHHEGIAALVISPDGKLIVSGGKDSVIKVWSLADGSLLRTLDPGHKSINALAISPDGKMLASGHYGVGHTVALWSLPGGKPLGDGVEDEKVNALAFSPDGAHLVSALGYGGDVKFWPVPDLADLKKTDRRFGKRSRSTRGTVLAMAFSPDNKYVAYGTADNNIELWSLPEGGRFLVLERHKKDVVALAISPDGKYVFSGSEDNTIMIWSLPDGKFVKELEGHEDSVTDLAVTPDGKLLVSGSHYGRIRLWSLPNGDLLKSIHSAEPWSSRVSLAITPDGGTLAAGGNGIQLFSLPEGDLKGCLLDPKCTRVNTDAISYREMGKEIVENPRDASVPEGANCVCHAVGGSVTYQGSREVCVCDTVTVPSKQGLPKGVACVCNTVAVGEFPEGHERESLGGECTCDTVCSCDTVCTCDAFSFDCGYNGGRGRSSGHYWRSN
jgi:WD40 repeat protein